MPDLSKIVNKLADELESFLTGIRELVEMAEPPPPAPQEPMAVYVDTSGSTTGNTEYAEYVNTVVDAIGQDGADFFTWDGQFRDFFDPDDDSQVWCFGGTPSLGMLVAHQREHGYKYIVIIGDGITA